MRREVRLLKQKAIDSLVLSIELFNRPRDDGRVVGVLIHADHAFEMLMKAAIRHRGGRIRKAREAQTIGFKEYVGKLQGVHDRPDGRTAGRPYAVIAKMHCGNWSGTSPPLTSKMCGELNWTVGAGTRRGR